MGTITIGVDLAKSVFSVCKLDGAGRGLYPGPSLLHRLNRTVYENAVCQTLQTATHWHAMRTARNPHHWQ